MNLDELKKQLSGLVALAEKALNDGDMEKYAELEPQITETETKIKAAQRVIDAKTLAEPPAPPKKQVVNPLPLGADEPPEDPDKAVKAAELEALQTIRVLRYGDLDASKAAIAKQVYGDNYLKMVDDQERAFDAYVRFGEKAAGRVDFSVLNNQVWHIDDTMDMLKVGMNVAEVKDTMIEGTDVLGGYAVPPQRARQVIQRLRGLTAVRAAGALTITTAANSISWLKVRGYNVGGSASDQYPTGLRGSWGHETQSPSASNFEFGLETIPVEVYTYKVPMSVSLLEDAPNVVTILMGLVADTLAVDEDDAFVQGDGANKPRGLLPGAANSHSFTELNSGHATEIKVDTTKRLRRKIASQYRRNGRANWMWESATAEIIETWQDGIGRFYYDTTEAGEQFLRFPVQETESMPSIASSAFPILFGDFSGYAIVERLGMAIVRFMDSNTTVNQVEYQVRRRIGGDVIEPYKFALIKVSA